MRIPFKRCAECSSARVEQLRNSKLVRDFGPDNKVHNVALIVGEGVCLDCGARSKAPMGVLEGTSFGPRLLGVVDEYFHVNSTDAAMAQVFERVHSFKMSPNAVLNAREALADSLRRHQIQEIMDEFSKYGYVIADETFFVHREKGRCLGDAGPHGGARLVQDRARGLGAGRKVRLAVRQGGRGRWVRPVQDVLRAHIARLGTRAALHALRAAAHQTALAPFTVHDLVLEARRLAPMFDREFETELYNAAPDLFTFVWKKGVPDNTALVEVTIRDALVRQRNVRHQMTDKKGMERFSALVSFNHTCELNEAWPSRAVR